MARPRIQGTDKCLEIHPGVKCDPYIDTSGRQRCRAYNTVKNVASMKNRQVKQGEKRQTQHFKYTTYPD